MFSNIGNIFAPKPREAESADTRLGIRHHDPDQDRQKKNRKDKEQQALFSTEDDATVSIEALRVFLENFLRSSSSGTESPEQETAPHPDLTEQQPGPRNHADSLREQPETQIRNETAARAAHTYQAMADSMDRAPAPASAPPLISSTALKGQDVRTIHSLLDDLKILSERNVKHLRIERSDSFLHSLATAAVKAKAGLSI